MARKAQELVVDLEEAARRLLTKPSTIRREIREGKLKAIKLGGKLVVRVAELENYLLRKEDEGVPLVRRGRRKRASVEIGEQPPPVSEADDEPPSLFEQDEPCEEQIPAQEEALSQGE